MTDHSTEPRSKTQDEDLAALEAADPAEAPPLAEQLAERLSDELDGTRATRVPDPEDRS